MAVIKNASNVIIDNQILTDLSTNNYKLNDTTLTFLKLNNTDVTKVTLNNNIVYEASSIIDPILTFDVYKSEDFEDFSRYYLNIYLENRNDTSMTYYVSGNKSLSGTIQEGQKKLIGNDTWEDDSYQYELKVYFEDSNGNKSKEITKIF